MSDKDVEDMSWGELELYAIEGGDWGLKRTAAARAEIRSREKQEREAQDEIASKRETQRRKFEERLVEDQIKATEAATRVQLRIARASAWAAGLAAFATAVLAAIAALSAFWPRGS